MKNGLHVLALIGYVLGPFYAVHLNKHVTITGSDINEVKHETATLQTISLVIFFVILCHFYKIQVANETWLYNSLISNFSCNTNVKISA